MAMDPWTAHHAAWRGDLAPLDTIMGCAGGAQALALRAQRWQAEPTGDAPPITELLALERRPDDWAALAARMIARAAWLRFDREGLRQATEAHDAFASGRDRLWSEALHSWLALADGAAPTTDLRALESSASGQGMAPLVIEAATLRAMAALEAGDLPLATSEARRASRMARVEAMPQQEYLANVGLARVRRHNGHPHLASRITAGLAAVAPAPWSRWLGWETRLSGEPADAPAIDALVGAAVAGDRPAFTAAARALCEAAPPVASGEREALELAAALDPSAGAMPEGIRDWASGEVDAIGRGLDASVSGTPNPHPDVSGHSWVLAGPHGGRRVLHPGIGLLAELPRIEQTTRKHGRGEKAAAVLALAGPKGLSLQRFVPAVYGFHYSPDAHDGVLRVLIHRLRKSLGDSADLERSGDRLTLVVHEPLWIPDPRTESSIDSRLLRAVAARPGATAKEVAEALRIPLRTAQAKLAQLVEDGACDAEREGRQLHYSVEDTTFAEPTQT